MCGFAVSSGHNAPAIGLFLMEEKARGCPRAFDGSDQRNGGV
jgi:hypothetical protein